MPIRTCHGKALCNIDSQYLWRMGDSWEGKHITSKMGLVYTYAMYLIGKRDFGFQSSGLES